MEHRKTLTITLETVTPLFLGGAEPRPELRPPAFRGAMRYWLRAALGGVIGDCNLADLHKLESAAFGNTDYGSPIHLRLRGNPRTSDEKILPHKNAGPRKAFGAGQKFDLVVSLLRSDDETIWRAACSILNLTLTCGGIGLRSRRGSGTLRVVKSSDAALVSLTPIVAEGWKQHIKKVLEQAIAAMRGLAQSREVPLTDLLPGPARHPSATRLGLIRICRFNDPKPISAMDAVTRFMQHASGNYAFGGIKPRQASPLWVRPIQLDDHYGLLFTVLASQFNGADYETVRNFLDQEFPGEDIRVKGWNA
jgi:CRISPR-associated protein Cmr1